MFKKVQVSESEAVIRFAKIAEIYKAYYNYPPFGKDKWIDFVKDHNIRVKTADKALERLADKDSKAPGLSLFKREYYQVCEDIKEYYRQRDRQQRELLQCECAICGNNGWLLAAADINSSFFSPDKPQPFKDTIYKQYLPCYGKCCTKGEDIAQRIGWSEKQRIFSKKYAIGPANDPDTLEKFENFVKKCRALVTI